MMPKMHPTFLLVSYHTDRQGPIAVLECSTRHPFSVGQSRRLTFPDKTRKRLLCASMPEVVGDEMYGWPRWGLTRAKVMFFANGYYGLSSRMIHTNAERLQAERPMLVLMRL